MMPMVSRPKIVVPRRRDELLSRGRLLRAFDDILDYRLTVITAPAGYGKTSLLVDFAHQSTLPVCWFSLDELDKEPIRFFLHFVAAIERQFPAFGEQSFAFLRESIRLDENIDQLVATIVNDIFDNITEHFLIVLDDYHLVEGSEVINQFINRFVLQVGENCHLVIASRTLIGLPDIPLLIGRSQVWGLSFEELAFTQEEVQALVSQNYDRKISRKEAKSLVRTTEGWITGLLLTLQAELGKRKGRANLERVAGVGVYDYLAQQAFAQQPPVVQDFLLRTSLFESFNADLCYRVLGDPPQGYRWEDLIAIVIQSNLFVQPIEDAGTWMRYHHLFRDFLQKRMRDLRSAEREAILRRLADYYMSAEQWEQAYDVYLRLGDTEAAADLIETAGRSMLRSGRLNAVGVWIDALPDNVLEQHPVLVSLRGYIDIMLGELDRGIYRLNRSIEQFMHQKDDLRMAGALTWRSSAYLLSGDLKRALEDAERALQLIRSHPRAESLRAEALRTQGLCLVRLGDATRGTRSIAEALSLYRKLGDKENIARVSNDLGIIYRMQGEYEHAEQLYRQALAGWQETRNRAQELRLLNNLGVLYHARQKYDQAFDALNTALKYARQMNDRRAEAYALASIGDLYLDLDVSDAAIKVYRQALDLAQEIGDRYLLVHLYASAGVCAALLSDTQALDEFLSIGQDILSGDFTARDKGVFYLKAGEAWLISGNLSLAKSHLKKALDLLQSGNNAIDLMHTHLLLASVYHRLKKDGDVYIHLQAAEAFIVDMDEGEIPLTHTLWQARPVVEKYGRDLDNAHKLQALNQRMILLEEQVPSLRKKMREQVRDLPFTPPQLEIRALGRQKVSINGVEVSASEWVHQRAARNLFFYILQHREGVTREQAGAVIWPESSSTRLKQQFKNAVFRLRRALGQQVIIFENNYYRFNRQMDYVYDVEQFLTLVEKAKAQDDERQRLSLYLEAAEWYQGEYLPEVDETWVVATREQLRMNYLETLQHAAELALDLGEFRLGLSLAERGLEVDDCLEELYCLAMRGHALLGDQVGVIRQFERCKTVLMDELGVHPSPRTEALFRELAY